MMRPIRVLWLEQTYTYKPNNLRYFSWHTRDFASFPFYIKNNQQYLKRNFNSLPGWQRGRLMSTTTAPPTQDQQKTEPEKTETKTEAAPLAETDIKPIEW